MYLIDRTFIIRKTVCEILKYNCRGAQSGKYSKKKYLTVVCPVPNSNLQTPVWQEQGEGEAVRHVVSGSYSGHLQTFQHQGDIVCQAAGTGMATRGDCNQQRNFDGQAFKILLKLVSSILRDNGALEQVITYYRPPALLCYPAEKNQKQNSSNLQSL